MSPRERAEIAMRGGRPDRVPVVPLIDTSYAAACLGVPVSQCFLSPEVHAQALLSALEQHPGIDGLSINIGLTADVIVDLEEFEGGYTVTTIDGSVWGIPMNDIGTPTTRSVINLRDERLSSVDVLRPHIAETLGFIPSSVLKNYDVSAGLTGPFSQVLFMMGIEPAMVAMQEEPEALKEAIEARMPFALRWAEELAVLGAPSVWIGEGYASTSLISPRQYEEFVLPYEQRVTAHLRRLGVPSVLHICGKTTRVLESIASSGADCFEVDWLVDLEEAKRRIGSRMSIKGNVHTTRLVQSSPEEIYAEGLRAIEKAGAGGGFLLSSGCALGRDTPPENVDALVRAAEDFGGY